MKSKQASPVLTDPAPLNKSKLSMHSSSLPYSQSGVGGGGGGALFRGNYIAVQRKKPGKFDDVRSNGWLDAMKSSSPPRKKLIKDFNVDVVGFDDFDIAYRSWMVSNICHCCWIYNFVILVLIFCSYFCSTLFSNCPA